MSKELEVITKDNVTGYLQTFGLTSKLNKMEVQQFIEIATAFQLNPFKREIYCIPYMKNVKNEKGQWLKERALSIITGYEVYLKRAERLKVLDGWSVKTDGKKTDGTLKAIVTIHRNDWKHPLEHEVYFDEYNQKNKIWNEKPITMIKKVAIAQAFRLAFPDEMGGMPYTNDELPDEMTTNVTDETEIIEPDKKTEQPKLNDMDKKIEICESLAEYIKEDTFTKDEIDVYRQELKILKNNDNSKVIAYQDMLDRVKAEYNKRNNIDGAEAAFDEKPLDFEDDDPEKTSEPDKKNIPII